MRLIIFSADWEPLTIIELSQATLKQAIAHRGLRIGVPRNLDSWIRLEDKLPEAFWTYTIDVVELANLKTKGQA